LGRSGEGLRAAQRNARSQPNSEQDYKDQSYDSTNQHLTNQHLMGTQNQSGLGVHFGPTAMKRKAFPIKITACAYGPGTAVSHVLPPLRQ
jgi:hypothetical protein